MAGNQVFLAAAGLALFLIVVEASSDTVYSDHVYYKEDITTAPITYSKTRNCYQCSYTPPRTSYVEKEIELKVHDPKYGGYKLIRQKKLVPEEKVGGWLRCAGKFSDDQAHDFGIHDLACDHNCYVRVDKAGNLFRGCYGGEFGVDPYNTRDIQQVGNAQYQFCDGANCNNFDMTYTHDKF